MECSVRCGRWMRRAFGGGRFERLEVRDEKRELGAKKQETRTKKQTHPL